MLVKGVIDMQVEFGLDPKGNGQLQYVNSAGYQTAYWNPALGVGTPDAPPAADTTYNSCLTGASRSGGSQTSSLRAAAASAFRTRTSGHCVQSG